MTVDTSVRCTTDDLADLTDFLVRTRRHIHQHPELSFCEEATSELVASHLESWGIDVTRDVGGYGVVGTLAAGDGSRSIALRADMDALPIKENSSNAWASSNEGVMHACGHDGHTTMLLGAARQLARTRNFSGTVHFVFQPAEEAGKQGGAQCMIADGLFERFPCDAIFGLHNDPDQPAGKLLFGSGAVMSAVDTVYITLHGKGGHGARPQQSLDPVVAASSLVMALQTVVSRNVNPVDIAVVTVGALQAGTVSNVIPDTASLQLTVRSFDEGVRAMLKERITTLAHSHAEGYGMRAQIDYQQGYPVLVNTEAETRIAQAVGEELIGADQVGNPFLSTGSEDFAYYLQQKPGSFLRLGNGTGGAKLHSAEYDFNDECLTVGAAYWTRLVETFLGQ